MANKLASMTELAEIISSRTQYINDFLAREKLPQPSLRADGGAAADFLPAGNKAIQQARLELRDATNQLHLLTAGTDRALFELSMLSQHDANALRVISTYRVPQHVPLDGAISYAELSRKCGLEQSRLERVLRYAMTTYVFQESADGVAHTSLSKALATDSVQTDWIGHIMEDMFPVTAHMVDAFQKWPGSDAPNHTGFHLLHNTDLGLFEWFAAYHPSRVARFGNAMTFYSSLHEQEVLDFDWTSLGTAVLVDVGGGYGHKAARIARTAPQLRCVVQDLEDTIKSVPPLPGDVQSRFTFEVYDFFTPQPQTTADVFLFARIFHDWSDESCAKILANLVPSMKKGARLMINDAILLPPNEGSVMDQRSRRSIDIHMMIALNAKERSLDEWKQLVEKGSDGKLAFEFASGGALISFIRS